MHPIWLSALHRAESGFGSGADGVTRSAPPAKTERTHISSTYPAAICSGGLV